MHLIAYMVIIQQSIQLNWLNPINLPDAMVEKYGMRILVLVMRANLKKSSAQLK